MHGYRRASGVYESTCTVMFVLVLSKTSVSGITCSLMALLARSTCIFNYVSTGNALPMAALLVILVV